MLGVWGLSEAGVPAGAVHGASLVVQEGWRVGESPTPRVGRGLAERSCPNPNPRHFPLTRPGGPGDGPA